MPPTLKCHKPPTDACVGVFSPSEPITTERRPRFERGLAFVRDFGFQIKVPEEAYYEFFYMAGKPEIRVQTLHALVSDPEVDILWAAWGGKSCNQLLTRLDYERIAAARKPILAFSDGCVLLNAITALTGLITFSGPNVIGKAYESQHARLSLLTDEHYGRSNNLLGESGQDASISLVNGVREGKLVGGNLSTFVLGLTGSKFMPDFSDVIFFWESVADPPQLVDQYLTCLRNAGFFSRVRGMVIGSFIEQDAAGYRRRDPLETVMDVLAGLDIPVLYAPTFGHLATLENPVLPIGALCELNSAARTLSLLEDVID